MKPIRLAIKLLLALAGAAVPAMAQAGPAGYSNGHQDGRRPAVPVQTQPRGR